MKNKWPTLKGRLKYPLITEEEALKQLSKTIELTKFAKRKLKISSNSKTR
jgi:hypothetical protein